MLQFDTKYVENEQYINEIITAAEGVLKHRKELYERLTKKKGTQEKAVNAARTTTITINNAFLLFPIYS